MRRRPVGARAPWAAVVVSALVGVLTLAACGSTSSGDDDGARDGGARAATVRLYTSYSQPEVDALVRAYRKAQPEVRVEVFRAPTGQLSARIAAEERSGGVRADVLLLSDPLSMQQYAARGMLRRWTPAEASVVPPEARSDTFWGVTTSAVVVVSERGKAPRSWAELASPRYRGDVAVPDPTFAGSAFGALGYFAMAEGYGIDFYRRLKANGAVQVQAPGDVISGVAEGRFAAGMTLDFLARAAITKGSPLELSAPAPGGIRLYAPVAVFGSSKQAPAAEAFANFLLTRPAQEALAAMDRTPVRADVRPPGRGQLEVVPDWPRIFARQAQLQSDYRTVFGG